LTRGELGSRGTAETRDAEAADSARMMGALVRDNLRMADGFFTHSQENLLKIVRKIRQYQPELVLANALSDRHPDHGRAAKLTSDAIFISGLIKVETHDDEGNPQKPWRPKNTYHYIQDHSLEPDFVVDITPYIEQKEQLILAFKTQFFNPDIKGPKTPISGKDFLEFLRARARTYGRQTGFEYAEGYNVSRMIGVKDLFVLR